VIRNERVQPVGDRTIFFFGNRFDLTFFLPRDLQTENLIFYQRHTRTFGFYNVEISL